MRRNINNVEIVEPPIGELTRRYSKFSAIRRVFLAGCGCLIIFVIGAAIALRLAMGSGPAAIQQVPNNFPPDIPVYDKDSIEKITFISGKYKNRGIEIAAIFPKIILSPLLLSLDKEKAANSGSGYISSAQNLWKIISSPVSDHRDTAQIEWKNLNTDWYFLINYYKTELGKNGYTIDVQSEGQNVQQFSFSKGGVSGSFYVQDNDQKDTGTDYAALTVNLEPAK